MRLNNHYRMTNQRTVILDELRKTKSHPTADEIYVMVKRVLPSISLGTVYRNLEVLSVMMIISKLEFIGSQKRFDGNTVNHCHICCTNCNRIDDVSLDIVKKIEFSRDKIKGFQHIDHCLYFVGICEECTKKVIKGDTPAPVMREKKVE